jgi:hypothetical protein
VSNLKSPIALQSGDVIGFTGGSWVSDLINIATFGVPRFSTSHIGIVAEHQNELLLFESTTLSDLPCRILGKPIKGSQAQRFGPRLRRYRGKVWHYPLFRPLYAHESKRLSEFLISGLGRPYDQIGAVRAGGIAFSWLESKIHKPNLASLFCSEWVAAALAQIGMLRTTHVIKWYPNKLIRYSLRHDILQKPRRLK